MATEEPVCHKCNEKITQGRILKSMGFDYHPICFCCTGCEKPITSSFKLRDDKPYCQDCVDKETRIEAQRAENKASADSKICNECGKSVEGEILSTNNRFYHPDCFRCGGCGVSIVSLGTMSYAIKDDKPLCGKCVEKANAKVSGKIVGVSTPAGACEGCGKPVAGAYVMAEGHKYHQGCFVCSQCKGDLAGGYARKDDKPVCGTCVQSMQKSSGTTTTYKSGGSKLAPSSQALGAAANNSALKSKVPMPAPPPMPASETVAALTTTSSAKFCGVCGTKATGGKFCGNCGAKMT